MITTAMGSIQQIQSRFDQLLVPTGARSASASAQIFGQVIATMEAQSAATEAPAESATGESIVDSAKKYEGVPYVLGGTDSTGIDCSGLVQTSLADVGITVGRLVSDQSRAGTAVPSLAQAKPGDLIVLNGGEHIVIYAGDGNVIHAPAPGRSVILRKAWFTDADIVTIRRVAPDAPAVAAAAQAVPSADVIQALIQAQTAMLAGSLK